MIDVKKIRKKTGLSQAQFAKKYHINLKTLQNWEQGRVEAPEYVEYILNKIIEIDYPEDGRVGQLR